MKQLNHISKKVMVTMLFVFISMIVAPAVIGQIDNLEALNQALEEQDKPLKDIIGKIADWILIAGAIVVLLVALFNKEYARPAVVVYLSILIFWMIIKAIFLK
jgi:hypothetical protein